MGASGGPPFAEAEIGDARESGLTAVRLSLAPQGAFWFDDAAFRRTLDAISEWDQQIIARPDVFSLVLKGADLQRAQRERKLGHHLRFPGNLAARRGLDRIELFHKLGVRVIQLTHNRRNLVGDGCMEPGNAGLSNFGHKVVEAINAAESRGRPGARLGRGRRARGSRQSKAPMLIGHTGCAALADLPRNA